MTLRDIAKMLDEGQVMFRIVLFVIFLEQSHN